MKRILAIATAALTAGAAQAQVVAQAQQPLAFVTCPQLRDTASLPCWLAEYKGERYYLATQGDAGINLPMLGRQALIEGTSTGEMRCGGKVLADLHVSVRPDRDGTCDAILPATEAFPIAERGPGGSVDAAAAATPTPPASPTASLSHRFEVHYDFDWQTAGQEAAIIQEAAAYAMANPLGEVHVTGYRAAVKLSGGQVLAETDDIDLRRAHEIVETLLALGVKPRDAIFVKVNPLPELGDFTRRRAAIDVIFGGSDDHSEH